MRQIKYSIRLKTDKYDSRSEASSPVGETAVAVVTDIRNKMLVNMINLCWIQIFIKNLTGILTKIIKYN